MSQGNRTHVSSSNSAYTALYIIYDFFLDVILIGGLIDGFIDVFIDFVFDVPLILDDVNADYFLGFLAYLLTLFTKKCHFLHIYDMILNIKSKPKK